MTVVVGPTFRSIFATVCQYFYCCVLHKTTSFNMPPKVKAKAKVKVVAKSKATAAKNDNIETDNPIKFRLSGTGGTAKSTLNGYQSALYHFNAFLSAKGLPDFDTLSEKQLCCIELFQEYGTYLSEFARKKRKVICFEVFSSRQSI